MIKDRDRRRAYLRDYYAKHKEAKLAYHKAWRDRNKQHCIEYRNKYRQGGRGAESRWLKYGITPTQFTQMLIDQEGACAICEKIPSDILRVDHDHVTGAVRALLCRKCNTGIGFLGDSVQSVTKALMYLRFHDAKGRRALA